MQSALQVRWVNSKHLKIWLTLLDTNTWLKIISLSSLHKLLISLLILQSASRWFRQSLSKTLLYQTTCIGTSLTTVSTKLLRRGFSSCEHQLCLTMESHWTCLLPTTSLQQTLISCLKIHHCLQDQCSCNSGKIKLTYGIRKMTSSKSRKVLLLAKSTQMTLCSDNQLRLLSSQIYGSNVYKRFCVSSNTWQTRQDLISLLP